MLPVAVWYSGELVSICSPGKGGATRCMSKCRDPTISVSPPGWRETGMSWSRSWTLAAIFPNALSLSLCAGVLNGGRTDRSGKRQGSPGKYCSHLVSSGQDPIQWWEQVSSWWHLARVIAKAYGSERPETWWQLGPPSLAVPPDLSPPTWSRPSRAETLPGLVSSSLLQHRLWQWDRPDLETWRPL